MGYKRRFYYFLCGTLFFLSCTPAPRTSIDEVLRLVRNGKVDELNELLKGNEIEKSFLINNSTLRIAAENNDLPMLDFLFENGAEANQEYKPGYPLAFWLIRQRQEQAFMLFMENGFDINTQSQDPKGSLLHFALHHLPQNRFYDLLSKKIDLEIRDSNNRTVLSSAIYHKKVQHAIMLIQHGADLNYHCFDDATIWIDLAYHWTIMGSIQVAETAFEHGAKIENNGTDNGLYASVLEGNYEFTVWLLEHGADPSEELDDGSLPIDYAWRYAINYEGPMDERNQIVVKNIEDILMAYGSRPPAY